MSAEADGQPSNTYMDRRAARLKALRAAGRRRVVPPAVPDSVYVWIDGVVRRFTDQH